MNEEKNNTNVYKKRNKKKRISFVAKAKRGQMGGGTRLPEDLYQYFAGILDAIKHDVDEKGTLVNNVLKRTIGEELNVVGNQLGSRLVEILLPFASAEDLERFIDILSPELRRLCSDSFSSHVVEKLLRVSCCRATENLQNEDSEETEPKKKKKKNDVKPDYSEEHIKKCYNFTIKMCKYALNNLEDFVWDNYANHILRSAIKSLSGITLLPDEKPEVNMFEKTKIKHNKAITPLGTTVTSLEYKVVPDEFKELVKEFATRLMAWPQFKDLPYQVLTSALIQVLLYAIKNVDSSITKKIIKKLLDESFAPDDGESRETPVTAESKLPPVFDSEAAIRLLEAALFLANNKMYTRIYEKCFVNRLCQLVSERKTAIVVQKLIDGCQVKEMFEPIFDELSGSFELLLSTDKCSVLAALARTCVRLRARQNQFIISLEGALKCTSENQKYFSVLCLRLSQADQLQVNNLSKEYFVSMYGSLILQSILYFQRPAKAVNSLLELSSEELMIILQDSKGCHVAEAFCKSTCVGAKARDKFVWKLKGCYQKLAISRYGSIAIEHIFAAVSDDQKVQIMSELADKSGLLNSTNYGRLVADKLDVATFRLSQKKWEQVRLKIKQ
ncbi:unnamed protein product [Diatraea saccharalis]|uniref:Nucleolar protein 9 n=1 Tax=Diatraea saccharalis TaxID=40085 RepID=A0A9N9WJB8_9NEOP|nr:unnamed protein product [Diatraea saccharalis]